MEQVANLSMVLYFYNIWVDMAQTCMNLHLIWNRIGISILDHRPVLVVKTFNLLFINQSVGSRLHALHGEVAHNVSLCAYFGLLISRAKQIGKNINFTVPQHW